METLSDIQILFARLLGKSSTYPEAPATSHLEAGFLGFPVCASKYSDSSNLKLLLQDSYALNQNFAARVSSRYISRF